jgi:hypothetical protein
MVNIPQQGGIFATDSFISETANIFVFSLFFKPQVTDSYNGTTNKIHIKSFHNTSAH